MGLAGTLGDLELGELLQVLALTARSGLLALRTTRGEGWILFDGGQVRSAVAKGGPEDLRGLLLESGAVLEADYEAARRAAAAAGAPIDLALASEAGLAPERLEELRRGAVEAAVVRMFGWRDGEFRLERGGEERARRRGLWLATPLPTQYLALEGVRLLDEGEAEGEDERAEAPAAAPRPAVRPLVVIDPALGALEWLKASLQGPFAPVHIFQRTELGLSRIRQYLARGTRPAVLLSQHARPDPLSGARDAAELVARLELQAPRMPVVLLAEDPGPGGALPPVARGAAGRVVRPDVERLRSVAARRDVEQAAGRLREDLLSLVAEADAP